MKKPIIKYYILLLLFVMFAIPGILAYVFYQHPGWLGSAKINKGTLLSPPLALNLSLPAGKPKWRIIFWSPGVCDKNCLQQLDTLARIRLALGRKLYQVDQWLILGDQAPPVSTETQALLKELDFQLVQYAPGQRIAPGVIFPQAKIFLANPDNFLILSYAPQVNPEDIYQDLKLLLNTTQSKSE